VWSRRIAEFSTTSALSRPRGIPPRQLLSREDGDLRLLWDLSESGPPGPGRCGATRPKLGRTRPGLPTGIRATPDGGVTRQIGEMSEDAGGD
jgi:hypothetical protein